MSQKIFQFFWKKVGASDAKRLAKQTKPQGVDEVTDIPYIADGSKYHMLDVYRPTGVTGSLPVIIDIHGGGWYYGDKELNKYYAMSLVHQDFAVVGISYRLAPGVNCAEQIRDCVSAVNYVYDHAAEYGLDKNNFYLTGDSAGGHLTAMVSNLAVSEKMQEHFGIKCNASFNALCFTCPALEAGALAVKPIYKLMLKGIIGDDCNVPAALGLYNYSATLDTNKCPSFFISGYADMMRWQTKKGYELAKSKGIPCELSYQDTSLVDGHTLKHVFNVLYPMWEESKLANGAMLDFFRKYYVEPKAKNKAKKAVETPKA